MQRPPGIVLAIQRYYPEWEPPRDNGKEWISCLCPFHGDTAKSASVSFRNNAYRCFACTVKGDAISIIKHGEGVNYPEAKRIAEELSPGSSKPVSPQPARKPGRRVFTEAGVVPKQPSGREVPSGIRRRPTPWS